MGGHRAGQYPLSEKPYHFMTFTIFLFFFPRSKKKLLGRFSPLMCKLKFWATWIKAVPGGGIHPGSGQKLTPPIRFEDMVLHFHYFAIVLKPKYLWASMTLVNDYLTEFINNGRASAGFVVVVVATLVAASLLVGASPWMP